MRIAAILALTLWSCSTSSTTPHGTTDASKAESAAAPAQNATTVPAAASAAPPGEQNEPAVDVLAGAGHVDAAAVPSAGGSDPLAPAEIGGPQEDYRAFYGVVRHPDGHPCDDGRIVTDATAPKAAAAVVLGDGTFSFPSAFALDRDYHFRVDGDLGRGQNPVTARPSKGKEVELPPFEVACPYLQLQRISYYAPTPAPESEESPSTRLVFRVATALAATTLRVAVVGSDRPAVAAALAAERTVLLDPAADHFPHGTATRIKIRFEALGAGGEVLRARDIEVLVNIPPDDATLEGG